MNSHCLEFTYVLLFFAHWILLVPQCFREHTGVSMQTLESVPDPHVLTQFGY